VTEPRWRVGRKLGRTLYRDDVFVGMVDTPEIAAEIVQAMNARDERRDRDGYTVDYSPEAMARVNERFGMANCTCGHGTGNDRYIDLDCPMHGRAP